VLGWHWRRLGDGKRNSSNASSSSAAGGRWRGKGKRPAGPAGGPASDSVASRERSRRFARGGGAGRTARRATSIRRGWVHGAIPRRGAPGRKRPPARRRSALVWRRGELGQAVVPRPTGPGAPPRPFGVEGTKAWACWGPFWPSPPGNTAGSVAPRAPRAAVVEEELGPVGAQQTGAGGMGPASLVQPHRCLSGRGTRFRGTVAITFSCAGHRRVEGPRTNHLRPARGTPRAALRPGQALREWPIMAGRRATDRGHTTFPHGDHG